MSDNTSFLYSRVNYETFHKIPTSDLSMNLSRMQFLLDRLDNPERNLTCVHVAGTKGKGSTSILLEAMARQAGYKTGLFTSPHILRIEERIQLNGKPCQTEDFDHWASTVEAQVEYMDSCREDLGPVTFFEITTAMAFLAFAEQKVDLAVLETGLGGRLDSTNVCKPVVTAITSIGIDHVAVLGDTEEKIAREKAGIIKAGIPVVVGRMNSGPRQVIEQTALEKHAPTIIADRDFSWTYEPIPKQLSGIMTCGNLENATLNLPGAHQAGNASIAIQLTKILNSKGFQIDERAIRSALQSVRIPGRIDIVKKNPMTIIDAAHNPDSFSKLADAIARLQIPRHKSVMVFACADDKNAYEMFKLIYPYFGTWKITKFQNNPRSCPPERLFQIFQQLESDQNRAGNVQQNDVEVLENSADAIQSAQDKSDRQLICIAGSFYLAAEAYREMENGEWKVEN